MAESQSVSATRRIAASASAVFDVLADPTAHAAIDGTGWVREPLDAAPLCGPRQRFRMAMHHEALPDKDYEMTNEVVTFDPPRAIAWRPGQPDDTGEVQFGGWFWRYDLVDVGDGSSDVTLSYDWSGVPAPLRTAIEFPPFAADHLENSLAHLAELADDPTD